MPEPTISAVHQRRLIAYPTSAAVFASRIRGRECGQTSPGESYNLSHKGGSMAKDKSPKKEVKKPKKKK
jgi:hypothetical protein